MGAPGRDENFVRDLEAHTGVAFHSHGDVQAYLHGLAKERELGAACVAKRARKVKQAALLLGLTFAFLQYYWIDALYQVAALPELTVFVAPPSRTN